MFDAPQIAFVAAAIATVGAATDVGSARSTVAWLAGWTALALVIGHTGRSRALWHRACYLAIGAAAAVAGYFVTQFSHLAVPDKIATLETVGRVVSARAPRLGSWTPFPNSVATLLEGFVLLAVGATLDARTALGRVFGAASAALIGFACLLTMSRGAWLAVGVAAIVWAATAVARRGVRPFIAAAAICAVAVLGLLMTSPAGLNLVTAAAAVGKTVLREDRLDIYRKSISLLNDVGIGGLGPGEQFAVPFAKFALVIQAPFVTYPHQLTLHLWLAYGIAGVVAWIWWLSASAAAVAAAERQQVSHTFRGTWCGLLAVLVHGLSDARQAVDPWTWCAFFVLSGLLAARHRRTGKLLSSPALALPVAAVALTLGLTLARFWPVGAAWHTRRGILDDIRTATTADHSSATALVESAEREYRQAIEIDPDRAGALRRLALIAADRGDFARAFEIGARAIRSDPDGYATRKIAGLVATWAGHLEVGSSLLRGVPGVVDELQAWKSAWSERGQMAAAAHSSHLASILANGRDGDR